MPNTIEHQLTPTQVARVQETVRQVETLRSTLNWFLSYIVDEAQLPSTKDGYQLSPDGTKLIGTVEDND